MPDYSNPNTKLTARRYAWDVTFQLGPVHNGRSITQDVTDGTYDTQPGATVGSLLAGLVTWFAKTQGHPTSDVTIVRYRLREK
ncbi:hypothetical protein AB0E62_34180 [Streptomyces sp. NPDC038707]|uniref:hypothetical protein n=1 Tax=Streptomyces sp. NPDC038707 TaxID=3154329 RepID=UPI0033C4A882